MSVAMQRWLSLAIVLGAAGYLAWRSWRIWRLASAARRKGGCGGGPGCGCG